MLNNGIFFKIFAVFISLKIVKIVLTLGAYSKIVGVLLSVLESSLKFTDELFAMMLIIMLVFSSIGMT